MPYRVRYVLMMLDYSPKPEHSYHTTWLPTRDGAVDTAQQTGSFLGKRWYADEASKSGNGYQSCWAP